MGLCGGSGGGGPARRAVELLAACAGGAWEGRPPATARRWLKACGPPGNAPLCCVPCSYGVWGDWASSYVTLDPAYEAAQLHVFGQMVLNGHIYRGRKPVHW